MKVLSYIMHGMFALALLMAAVLFFVPASPFASYYDVKIVKSGSMEPAIKTGGIVIISSRTSFGEGDVITFNSRNSDIPTTHRIVGVETENGVTRYVTKGDANEERDTETVPQSAILGTVIYSLPYAGFVLDFARQPLGFALLIGIPALLIVMDEIEKIWRELNRMRRKKVADIRSVLEPLIVAPYTPPRFRVRMFDINHPIPVPTMEVRKLAVESEPEEPRPTLRGRYNWMAGAAAAVALALLGTVSSGGTASLLTDMESSLENTLKAVALDLTAAAVSETTSFSFLDGAISDSSGVLETQVALASGSVPVRYDLTAQIGSGSETVCGAVLVKVDNPFTYEGPLMALSAEALSFLGEWMMDITGLAPGEYTAGDSCTALMRYAAWNAEYPSNIGGYDDVETVTLSFTVLGAEPVLAFSILTPVLDDALETEPKGEEVPPAESESAAEEETVPEIEIEPAPASVDNEPDAVPDVPAEE